MTAKPKPTGMLAEGPHAKELQLERRFQLPIRTVWAAMTEPNQLEQWIGRWEGDPTTGRVTFFMTAEGEDAPPEVCTILNCTPPHSFTAETSVGTDVWHLRFELHRDHETTTLLFAQRVSDEELASVGPGWEYYLDRLSSVLAGRDPAGVDWNDYYPRMAEYYQHLQG